MALQLSKELATGVTCDYWRVETLILTYGAAPLAKCIVHLYKDAAARAAGKSPAYQIGYDWSGADFTGWFDATTQDTVNYNPQERAYEKLKTLPEFTGAVDV